MKNEALQTIIECVLNQQLGKAIAQLENYLYTFTQPQATEQLEQIKADYALMTGYWRRGYEDGQREQLYGQLLRRMYVLTVNVMIRYSIRNSSYVMGIYNQARTGRQEWSAASLRRDMEAFVSEVALLELEPEHTQQQKRRTVYENHQRMMASLFDYIWTSRLWTDNLSEAFEDMLLSPTIDSTDQQLIVSAITVSLLNFFGINKFRLLLHVYQKSVDERVRQRALIGWVLGLNENASRLYTEIRDMVREAVEDEHCRSELAELQMQMIYCLRAESDNRIIQSEIMPELMKNNNIRVTRNGIEEVEDDPMEDVLHPELAEQRMEKLEETMHRMVDMQKQGSDIYFGGFKQMKRFPFFNGVGNWFLPFYIQHPVVEDVLQKIRGRKFLLSLLKYGPFCDSDKYSFVLAYQTAVNQISENLLSMMDRGEATVVGSELGTTDMETPAFIRRSYLQNLYRFFRVYPMRSEFVNPFEATDSPRYYFFANRLFQHTRLEEKFGEVVSFFVKQKAYDAAKMTLQNYREEARDDQFYLLNGGVMMRTHSEQNAGLTVRENYARLLEQDSENERGWAGYARALFGDNDYKQAFEYYQKLVDKHPDNQNYQLNAAVCLTNMGEHEEALKILYKLNYEAPDNTNINRVLAWTLVGARKYEQAEKMYSELLNVEKPEADDLLNAAYCHWFGGRIDDAAYMFRQYAQTDGVTFDAATEFLTNEAAMIRSHGVSDVEVRLMADMLL